MNMYNEIIHIIYNILLLLLCIYIYVTLNHFVKFKFLFWNVHWDDLEIIDIWGRNFTL